MQSRITRYTEEGEEGWEMGKEKELRDEMTWGWTDFFFFFFLGRGEGGQS